MTEQVPLDKNGHRWLIITGSDGALGLASPSTNKRAVCPDFMTLEEAEWTARNLRNAVRRIKRASQKRLADAKMVARLNNGAKDG